MNHKISNIFKNYLLTLDWSDKVSGLVQTANIRVKNGDSVSEKSYPISCDISESACIKGAYQDLAPDSKKKSVMYFEDGGASMVERVGNRMKLQSKLRLVVWLNHSKIQGVDCHVDATGCGTSGDYVIDVIKVLPSTPIQTVDFISIMVSDISQVERSVDIFSKYSYNETALQYLMFPYDYFALDLTVDFTIPCIVPQYVVPPVPVAVTDIDGNDYHSVIIGDQEWLIENLKTTTYADGTPIPNLILSSYDDWFLPSIDELTAMHTELHLHGLGGFTETDYWASSESTNLRAYGYSFAFGAGATYPKNVTLRVRACRSFTATAGTYVLRDIGPAGGYIFHVNGTTFYEAALIDQSVSKAWSNITNVEIGITAQGTAIGTGQTNTAAIISQVGHTDSSAKLCNDSIMGGWINDTVGAYCYYNNDIANNAIYGALYNWHAVGNVHGLAPTGWKVPSKTDFDTLIAFVGGTAIAGGKLKESGLVHWLTPNTGAIDDYGFKVLPGGVRESAGSFATITRNAHIWTSTGPADAYERNFGYNVITANSDYIGKKTGFSVRCMRDV